MCGDVEIELGGRNGNGRREVRTRAVGGSP